MKKTLNVKKTITALLLIYFVVTFARQETIIHRIDKQARIQRVELDIAKKENVRLTDKAALFRNNPDAYFEKLARDMQYIKEGETVIIDEESKK